MESIIGEQLGRPKSKRGDLAGSLAKLNFDEQLNRMGALNPAYKDALTGGKISRHLRQKLQAIFIGKEKDLKGRPLPLSRRAVMTGLDISTIALQVRADQIEALQGSDETRPEFSREEAETAVRTFLKTAQEVLSHEDDRQAFERDEGTVDDIIIDPLNITDTLLTNLGLEEYIPEKGTKEPEKVRQRAKAIPAIKEMLKHLEPIKIPGQKDSELKYFRLMRISAGKNEGMILGTQVIKGKKVLFKTDLYGAGRRIAHIETGYLEEIDLLRDIVAVIDHATGHINDWAEITEEDLAEIRSGMIECIENLENVEDKDKVALREQLELSFTFRDSLGRYNPQTMDSRLRKAKRHVGARLQGIKNISEYLTKDKLKMRGLVAEQVNPIEKFLTTVATTHHSFRLLKPESEMSPAKKAEILRNLEDLKAISDGQKYEPYLSFGRKFSAQLDKVIISLQSDDRQTTAHEFTKVYLVAKLERAYKELQATYSKISLQGDSLDLSALYSELEGIRLRLRDHDVAPDIKTTEYDQSFIEFYHLLNSLKKRLREIAPAQQNLDFESPADAESAIPQTPRQIRKTRMEEVLERVEKIPAVGKVIAKIRGILDRVLNGFKEPKVVKKSETIISSSSPDIVSAPATPPQKQLTRAEAFKAMKKRVKEFDFRELAQDLPA